MKNFNLYRFLFLVGILLSLFIVSNAKAGDYIPQDTDEIIVKRNGKVIGKMSRAEYKVVKIDDNPNLIPVSAPLLVSYMKAKKYQQSHHTVILHGGVGRDGLSINHINNNYEVSQRRQPVFGGTYCYTMTKTGVCATGISNETYMLGIKQDFN